MKICLLFYNNNIILCVTLLWALHIVIKTVFTLIFAVFLLNLLYTYCSSIFGWDITTTGLEKQTSTILEFYFRFRSGSFSRNLHFIVHQPAEFRPNRNSHCGNITSYRFIKMAASDTEYYIRFRICWYRCLEKVKVYEQTKFRRHIIIDGWDLTTSVFWKTNVRHIGILLPVLISTTSRNLHVILHRATEFRPNRSNHCRNMTSFPFFKMAEATAKYQFRFRIC